MTEQKKDAVASKQHDAVDSFEDNITRLRKQNPEAAIFAEYADRYQTETLKMQKQVAASLQEAIAMAQENMKLRLTVAQLEAKIAELEAASRVRLQE
jgi:hypothetical protein